jgi:anti-sigma B factor antagonist
MTPGSHHQAGDGPMSATPPESHRRSATFAIEQLDGVAVVRIDGELDLLTVPELRGGLYPAIAGSAGAVVIDLAGVKFLSSTGLRLLLSIHADLAAENRPLRLATGDGRAVVRPLEITGLNRLLDVYPDVPSALASGRGFRSVTAATTPGPRRPGWRPARIPPLRSGRPGRSSRRRSAPSPSGTPRRRARARA